MITEKMTIHKGLAELKLIGDRITKATNDVKYAVANKHSSQKLNGVSIDEYVESVKNNYIKVNDLIRRRNAIKRAIVLSNAVTKVNINGVEYTVAEAIEMKNSGMNFKANLAHRINIDYAMAKNDVAAQNGDKLETRADAYVINLYGTTDMKSLSEDVQKVRKDFIASQTYDLIDPIDANKVVEELNNEVTSFMTEVDAALSVSNAITEIEISY